MYDAHLLSYAIWLRQNQCYELSRERLFSLLTTTPHNGEIFLHIAWSYDNEGQEEEALRYYQKALSESLCAEDEFEAAFGLACTARCLGKLSEAETLFKDLVRRYPERSEIIPFYALCVMALNKASLANKLLMDLIIDHPPTKGIALYQPTLKAYWQNGRG